MIPATYYVVLSGALFFLGVIGVLTRRNPLIVLMAIELMWNAANVVLIAFARAWHAGAGQ